MSKANHDRNFIKIGTTKKDEKEWDRLEDRLQTDSTVIGPSIVSPGLVAGAVLRLGVVTTYSSTTLLGQATVGASTVNFKNATGFNLSVNDVVVLTSLEGVVGDAAVGIYSRAAEYDPIVFTNPSTLAGLPYDADIISPQHLSLLSSSFSYNAVRSTTEFYTGRHYTCAGYYENDELGEIGRKILFLPRQDLATNYNTVSWRNIDTGFTSSVSRVTTDWINIAAINGTKIYTSWGQGSYIYNTATATWTTVTTNRSMFAGFSGGYAWFLERSSINTMRLVSVDLTSGTISTAAGTLGIVDTAGAGCRAGNGYIYVWSSLNEVWWAPTTGNAVAVHPTLQTATFSANTTVAELNISYTQANSAGASRNAAYVNSIVGFDGYLYMIIRKGTPTTVGFLAMNPTSGVVSEYTQICSADGLSASGEPVAVSGIAVAAEQVIIGITIREDAVGGDPYRAFPATVRTDGITSTIDVFSDFVGLGGVGLLVHSGAAVFPTTPTGYGVHVRKSEEITPSAATTGPLEADVNGPAIVTALEI